MKTLLIIILVLAVVAGLVFLATKYLKAFKDEDKDGIPDVVEDKFEDIKEDVEDLVDDAKEKFEDIKEDVEEFVEEVKDIPAKLTRKKPGRSKKTTKKAPAKKTTGVASTSNHYKGTRKAVK